MPFAFRGINAYAAAGTHMEVIEMNGADFNVSVRGDNQPNDNKLLVMVDGRATYIDFQGQVMWKLLPVTLPEIKRIEVLKGLASAESGFNAFDGVISIITKLPEDIKETALKFGQLAELTWRIEILEAQSLGWVFARSRHRDIRLQRPE